jgi:flagellar motility protein MotE (MotC chaperone)
MDADYLPVETVANLLAVSTRHAHRACHKAGVRSSKAGRRTVYHRLDVERLAVELGAEYRTVETPAPAIATETAATSSTPPSTALVLYDALQRQLADVENLLQQHKREMAELKAMVAVLVERDARPDAPAVETLPRKPAWWRRLFK